MPAVKASFFRMSATRKAFRNVRSTALSLVLEDLAVSAGGFDLLAGGLGEAVGVDGQRLGQLAPAQDLDGHVAARGQAGLLERVGGHLGALVEAGLEVAEVDGLGARAELLERHRL